MSGVNKAIELQLHLRQNAEDLHSFMAGMESWETDMKKKDEELRTGGLQGEQVCLYCIPPPSLQAQRLLWSDLHVARCTFVVEGAPPCAQPRLQNEEEGKEEEEERALRPRRRDFKGPRERLKDKGVRLQIVGQVWRG